jgi:hypothetical protein
MVFRTPQKGKWHVYSGKTMWLARLSKNSSRIFLYNGMIFRHTLKWNITIAIKPYHPIGWHHPGRNGIFLYKSGHDMVFRHGSTCLHMRFILFAGTVMVAMGLTLHDMDFRCGILKSTGLYMRFIILLAGTILVAMEFFISGHGRDFHHGSTSLNIRFIILLARTILVPLDFF